MVDIGISVTPVWIEAAAVVQSPHRLACSRNHYCHLDASALACIPLGMFCPYNPYVQDPSYMYKGIPSQSSRIHDLLGKWRAIR